MAARYSGHSLDAFGSDDDDHWHTEEDDEDDAPLPPPRTMADMIRQLSEEGKKLLVASLDATPAPPPVALVRFPSKILRSIKEELEDIAAVYGRRVVGPVTTNDDGSAATQLRLKLHDIPVTVTFQIPAGYPGTVFSMSLVAPRIAFEPLREMEAICLSQLDDIVGSPMLMSCILSLEACVGKYITKQPSVVESTSKSAKKTGSKPKPKHGTRPRAAAAAGREPDEWSSGSDSDKPESKAATRTEPSVDESVPVPVDVAPITEPDAIAEATPTCVLLKTSGYGKPGLVQGGALFSLQGKLYLHGGRIKPHRDLLDMPVIEIVQNNTRYIGNTNAAFLAKVPGHAALLVRHLAENVDEVEQKNVCPRLCSEADLIPRIAKILPASSMPAVHLSLQSPNPFIRTTWFHYLGVCLTVQQDTWVDSELLWEFDPSKRTWRVHATGLPARVFHNATVVSATRVVLTGGLAVKNGVSILELVRDGSVTVRQLSSVVSAPFQSACRLPGTHSVILYGGVGVTTPATVTIFDSDTTIVTSKHTKGPVPGTTCSHHTALCTPTHMIVFGGILGSMRSNKFFALDLQTFSWSTVKQSPSIWTFIPHRADHCMVKYNHNEFLIFGGEGFSDVSFDDLYSVKTTPEDDGSVTITSRKLTMVSADKKMTFHQYRTCATAAAVGNYMWVFGGHSIDVVVSTSSLVGDLSKLLSTRSFSDITLKCADGTEAAHEAILAARCGFLRSLIPFRSVSATIDLPAVTVNGLKPVLQYLYTGGFSFKGHQYAAVMTACKLLDLMDSQLYTACLAFDRMPSHARPTRIEQLIPVGKIPTQLVEDLSGLLTSNDAPGAGLFDIALSVAEGQIQAHKVVLAARSPLFASYLLSGFTESTADLWPMDDHLSLEAIQTFVEFLYTDKANLNSLDCAMALINLGTMHSLPRLVSLCEKFILASMDFEDAESTLALLCFVLDIGDVVQYLRARCLYNLLYTVPRQTLLDTLAALGDELPPKVRAVVEMTLRTANWA